ncbi:MAG: sigma-70 family RNA polymerase sigma factor [Deltaproteobacteria bacterium]|nr:sigma-70 family RNA polymerase sigma factor [Deltaproteobacteria bacterium]
MRYSETQHLTFLALPSPTVQEGANDPAVEALAAALRRVVQKVCPAWLVNHRDDLVQAAILKVLDLRRRSGEGIDDVPSSLLYRVAHSALVDEIRRYRRRREIALESGGSEVDRSRQVQDPEACAVNRESGRAIRDCLSRMKQARRRAVTLYLQGNSVPESALVLGWDRKRTENLVFRGLTNLRDCLTKKGVRP